MATGSREAVVRIELVEKQSGLWCNTCRQATGGSVTLAYHGMTGGLRVVRIVRCLECRGEDVQREE